MALILSGPVVGCGPAGADALVIASTWPREAREELAAAYRRGGGPARPIAWVDLEPGDRAADALARRGGVDLIVGAPTADLARLAASGRLEPEAGSTPWRVVRRARPVPAEPPARPVPAEPPDPARPPVEFADPRDDPATLAILARYLDRGEWPARYAALARIAARGRPAIGRVAVVGKPTTAPSTSARANLRGEDRGWQANHSHPDAFDGSGVSNEPNTGEGAAIVRGGRHLLEARQFLAFLAETGGATEAGTDSTPGEDLLADLIGSTMIDAHDEMRDAWSALERHGHAINAEGPFVEPPPWPPASVARLRSEPADAPLLETLAEQVAPDPGDRAWLLESWARPPRPIDGATLDQLGRAAGGRLAREPRFRAWLRAEWTAWARQRYRRVARVARGWVPS